MSKAKKPKLCVQIVPFYPLPRALSDKTDYFLLPAIVLREKGYEVEFLTLKEKGSSMVELSDVEKRNKSAEQYKGFTIRRFSNVFSMYWYIIRKAYFVHAHLRPFLPSQFSGLLPKKKIITTFTYVVGSKWWIDALSTLLLKRYNRIFAVTPYEIMVYTDHSIPKGLIRLQPLAFDYNYLRKKVDTAAVKKELGIGANDFVVIGVAHIRKHKRYDVLLKAFCIVKKKVKNAKLIIVGDDQLPMQGLPAAKDTANKLGIGDSVVITGFKDAEFVRAAYQASHVFVHTADNEFQGLVSYEAAASGLPLCLSNIGSHTSVFKEHAFYHDVEDYEQLSHNILRCKERDATVRYNTGYLQEYMKNWDYEALKAKMHRHYDEVLNEA